MVFGRKKPVPTRRGRIRPGRAAPAEPAAEAAAESQPEAQTEAETEAEGASEPAETPSRPVAGKAPAAAGGGLEMALIVVTLVSLVAAFALLQLGMHSAFGEGWPV